MKPQGGFIRTPKNACLSFILLPFASCLLPLASCLLPLAFFLKKWCVTGLLATKLNMMARRAPNAPYSFCLFPVPYSLFPIPYSLLPIPLLNRPGINYQSSQ
ncbi:MAG: hypothetical protein F6K56_14785 [Moorea sp. SIO3G5]|nr:hypothetical protein [Moorena sp. SIO3G5]